MSSDARGRDREQNEQLPVASAWARHLIDAGLAALVLVVELGPMIAPAPPWNVRPPDGLDVARLVGVSLPLLLRRRFPVPVLVAGIVSFWGSDLLGFGLAITLYSVGAHTERVWLSRLAGPAGAIAVTAALVVYRNVGVPIEALLPLGVFGGAWFVGETIRLRRRYTAALQQRAVGFMQLAKEERDRMLAERRRLQEERAESERRAAAKERARIARDLHDIVAHRVSMMTVQAGAARVVADSDPSAAARAIALLEEAGRQTLSELRQLMGVMREDAGGEQPLDPCPTLDQLNELATQIQAAGVPVRLTVLGDTSDVPEAVEVSAYRIVQEALTNVLKHAGPGAEADVIVRCAPHVVEIDVTDSGRGVAGEGLGVHGGHGLIGMRERVAVFGGTLRYGPRSEGGFFVSAVLPTRETAE